MPKLVVYRGEDGSLRLAPEEEAGAGPRDEAIMLLDIDEADAAAFVASWHGGESREAAAMARWETWHAERVEAMQTEPEE